MNGGDLRAPTSPVTVSAWIGSHNAGDELVHAGLRRLLDERGVPVSAISLDPIGTTRRHGGTARSRRSAVAQLLREGPGGRVVLGGGGLIQDHTSAFNVPYHLLPAVAARTRGARVAGIGLGAGPITSRWTRTVAVAALRGLDITVRDEPSADVLAGLGLARPAVGCDLALELPDVEAEVPGDVLVVALRPWDAHRHVLPVRLRRQSVSRDAQDVGLLAAAVDAVAERLGVGVRLVAFDTDKDHALHVAVAARLRADVLGVEAASPEQALSEVAGARAVFAMRYHAAVAALLGRRPALLLGHDPKIAAIANDVGAGFVHLPGRAFDASIVADAAQRAAAQARDGVLDAALARLRARGAVNRAALDRLLES